MNTLPTVISLCCGTGTGEAAAKKFFSTTLAVDNSWIARCSYMANHPGVMVVCEDIRNPHLISAAKQKYGEIDGIISSTPCIMFSTANSTSAEEKALNENSTLYLSPLEWIEAFKPRFYISENVPQVRKSPLFLAKLARLERLGYRWDCFILDAADYGTPQHRARLFLVAVRGDIPLPLPPRQTHGDEDQRRADPKLLPYCTLKDSIYDLFEMELTAIRAGRHGEFLKHEMMGCAPLSDDRTWVLSHVPPGGNYMDLPEDVKRQVVEALQRRGKNPFAGLCSRLPWGITPGTLRTGPNCQQMTMPIHPGVDVDVLRKAAFWARRPRWIDPSNVLSTNPDGDKSCLIVPGYDTNDAGTILVTRCLAVREFQRLMGLPDDFSVLGNTTERYRQLGNGIAVQPMEALCRAVADALGHQSGLSAKISTDSKVPIESSMDSLMPSQTEDMASAGATPDEVKSFNNPCESSNPGKTAMQGVLSHPFATAAPGANNFAHLFDREHQTAMIQSAIDAATASRFENRCRSVLHGPPGGSKTDLPRSINGTFDTTVSVPRPSLRYYGGKWRIAPWIISHLPAHEVYVEPFAGAASVLMRKAPSRHEVINDLDQSIVTLFRVLRDPIQAEELIRRVELTPFSRREYVESHSSARSSDPIEIARRLIVRSDMAFGGLKPRWKSCGFRTTLSKNLPAEWNRRPGTLPAIIDRLKGCVIECMDALDCIRKYDGEKTLFFVDPPYVLSTRYKGRQAYAHEMDGAQHAALAQTLNAIKGKAVVSGYSCPLYDDLYRAKDGWRKETINTRNGMNTACVETVWLKGPSD